ERTICSIENLLTLGVDDPAIRIRSCAAKDKVIAQIADHVSQKNAYLDSKCEGRCKGITYHKQIARRYLFAGPDGPKYAKNFLGHLRTDVAENFLRQELVILEDFGLSCLGEHRITERVGKDDYHNLLRPPFIRGGN